MKRIIYTLLILSMGLAACQEERIFYDGPEYVRFTDSTLSVKESFPSIVEVAVHLVGAAQNEPVHITYSIGGTARNGRDYQVVGEEETLVIPAGQYAAKIPIRLINNANNILGSQDITIFLQTASIGENNALVSVGGGSAGLLGKSFRLIIEDDCLMGGIYTGTREDYAVGVRNIPITSNDCNEYTVTNWNIGLPQIEGFQGLFNADKLQLTFIDNGDNSLTIPSQPGGLLGGTLRGKGIWDPRNGKIQLDVEFRRTQEGETFSFDFPTLTYTPQRPE